MNNKTKTKVHFFVQGKGGIGKSTLALFLAQYLIQKKPLLLIDTDNINATFKSFSSLDVKFINLVDKQKNINLANCDSLVNLIASANIDVIVDFGVSTYLQLIDYIKNKKTIEFLAKNNKQVILNIILASGSAANDSLVAFTAINDNLRDQNIKYIFWLNEFLSKVEFYNKSIKNNVSFEETEIYNQIKKDVLLLIKMDKYKFGGYEIINCMLQNKQTFEDFYRNKTKMFMDKYRLSRLERDIYRNISVIDLI